MYIGPENHKDNPWKMKRVRERKDIRALLGNVI
jgi:hypothetical protein